MLSVTSEVGKLRRVLLHEPGPEVDRMVPAMMEELLFDDILFGDAAREEHGRFRRVLQLLGVELLEAQTLLVEALQVEAARSWLFEVLLADHPHALLERLRAQAPEELAQSLVGGTRRDPAGSAGEVEDLFEVPPLPNWCFQRDPQVVLGDGVAFCAMATSSRHPEALLSRALFRYHPALAGTPVLHDPLVGDPRDRPLASEAQRPCLEGGDVLVLSREVLAVGRSARTNRGGVLRLARALARRDDGPRFLIVVRVPERRAFMHLDTLITPVDRDACLVHAPVVLPGGAQQARVLEIDLHDRDLTPVACDDLLGALARRGVDLEPIPCGGPDPVAQQREQWTDGANALAVAPGLITLYDRNTGTIEELDRRGFRIVDAEDLLLGRAEVPTDGSRRVCVVIPRHELSRARGGPHCLTHPLLRDEPA